MIDYAYQVGRPGSGCRPGRAEWPWFCANSCIWWALAREQHFARAAASCHVAQPTLSAAIRQLEEELGAPIVERGHRFSGFTREGQAVLEHAKRILAECESMTQDLSKLKDGLIGRLRLGAIPRSCPWSP